MKAANPSGPMMVLLLLQAGKTCHKTPSLFPSPTKDVRRKVAHKACQSAYCFHRWFGTCCHYIKAFPKHKRPYPSPCQPLPHVSSSAVVPNTFDLKESGAVQKARRHALCPQQQAAPHQTIAGYSRGIGKENHAGSCTGGSRTSNSNRGQHVEEQQKRCPPVTNGFFPFSVR